MSHDDYRTSDLALAAYLKVREHSIKAIERDGNGKGTFVFEDTPQRPRHTLEFYDRRATVEPMAYLDQIKSLKAMLKQ